MRRTTLLALCLLLVTLVATLALTGCPKKTEGGDIVVTPDAGGEAMPADAGASQIPENPQTLAEATGGLTFPTSFAMTIIPEGEEPQGPTLMMMDGQKLLKARMESPEATIILDAENKVMYMWEADAKEAMQMPMDAEEDGDTPNPFQAIVPEAKVTGSEAIDGVDCWIAEIAETEANGPKGTVYIGKADGLIRKAVDGDDVVTFTYDRMNELEAKDFELPEGMTTVDMSEAMQGGGGAPPAGQ